MVFSFLRFLNAVFSHLLIDVVALVLVYLNEPRRVSQSGLHRFPKVEIHASQLDVSRC
jgi:predicted LPLAT superfamily acyltransferase